jgi:release factor glutamine methyltransferase
MSELLMSHVLGCDRLRLYMDQDRPASVAEKMRLRDLVGRALKHEPVQYLVGEGWFFGLPMHVSPAVLIPRPCTEVIVEEVLSHTRAEPGFGGKTGDGVRIADVCTGSGCIAIALLKNLPAATAIGTDISEPALAVAKKNAERHGVSDRLEFLHGDLLAPLIDHPAGGGLGLHYLVSNPPYIPDAEWDAPDKVDRNVRDFEPHSALRGGADGLTFVRPLIEKGPERLRPKGLMLIEIAAATWRAASKLLREHPLIDPETVRIVKDHEGLERVVVGTRKAQ